MEDYRVWSSEEIRTEGSTWWQVKARRELDLDRTDAPGRKVRPKNVEDIKQVEEVTIGPTTQSRLPRVCVSYHARQLPTQ